MVKKISLGLLIVVIAVVAFLTFVSTRENKFHYERTGVIVERPDKIFPYLSNFKMGGQWSPYEKMDSHMKKTYSGTEGQVGSRMEFEGNSDVGSGKLEILRVVQNVEVEIKLTMTKPMHAENIILYKLVPDFSGTRFVWSMSGEKGFMGKLISVFIDCEKMVGNQFSDGIANLKALIESKKMNNK